MKQCPRCNQTYSDDQLNFCLTDGELLTQFASEPPRFGDDPPTMVMNEARVTDPTNWPATPPPTQWNPQPLASLQQQPVQYAGPVGPSQTLAIVSFCLGIGSLTVGFCCSSGLLLSPAALITGFIALSQIKKDSSKYTGRGLAIGGMATGAAFLAIYVIIIIIYGAIIIGGSLVK